MKYKVGFINHLGFHQSVYIEDVDSIDVREGAYIFYNKDFILLYSLKVSSVCAIGNVELLNISKD